MEFDTGDIGKLVAKLEKLAQGTGERALQVAKEEGEKITGTAKGLVYQNGLHYQDGSIRDSLHGYASAKDGTLSFGVETENLIAIYHELGTGPVGTAAGYPGESYLDTPVTRRSTGWVYWSAEVAEKNSGITPGADYSFNSMQDYFSYQRSGFVYTEGVPPKAFMFNAVTERKDTAVETVAAAIMEGLKDE